MRQLGPCVIYLNSQYVKCSKYFLNHSRQGGHQFKIKKIFTKILCHNPSSLIGHVFKEYVALRFFVNLLAAISTQYCHLVDSKKLVLGGGLAQKG